MRWSLSLGLIAALVSCASCQRQERFVVEHLSVRTLVGRSPEAPGPVNDEARLRDALTKSGGFVLQSEGSSRQGFRVEATVGDDLEPSVLLSISRGDDQFEVEGSGEGAMEEAVRAAYLKLIAPTKSDRDLAHDATQPGRSERGRRDAAIEELIRRKSPRAETLLVDQLRSGDPVAVRRAIGGLVELRRTSAVPALIDLARGQDEMFLRELIFALSALGGEEARAYLFTVAQGHDRPETRAAAEEALRELEKREKSR